MGQGALGFATLSHKSMSGPRPHAPRAHALQTQRSRFPVWFTARAEGRMSPVWAGSAAGARRIVSSSSRQGVSAVESKESKGANSTGTETVAFASALPNSAVNPPHSVVTALAQGSKRRAAGRAGYRERSADKNW